MYSQENLLKIKKKGLKLFNKKESYIINSDTFLLILLLISCATCTYFKYIIPFSFGIISYVVYTKREDSAIIILNVALSLIFSIPFMAFRIGLFSALVYLFSKNTYVDNNDSNYITISSILVFVTGVIMNFSFSLSPINYIYILIESILNFIIFYIADTFFNTLENIHSKNTFTSIETISFNIILSIFILAFSSINIFGVNLAMLLSIVMMLFIINYTSLSISLTQSIITSLLLSLTPNFSYDLILIFSISTLFASLAKEFYKILSVSMFLFTSVFISFFVMYSLSLTVSVSDLITGSILYVILDIVFCKKIEILLKPESEIRDKNIFNDAIQKIIKEEIDTQKTMLKQVSNNINEYKYENTNNYIKQICTHITGDFCCNCDMYFDCWKTKGDDTYMIFSKVLSSYAKNPSLSFEDLPEKFMDRCKENFVMFKILTYLYDSFKLKQSYNLKINKFKDLMSLQFNGFSNTLDNIYENLKRGLNYYSNEEEKVFEALTTAGINVVEIVVLEDFYGKLKIFLKVKNQLERDVYTKDIPIILREVLSKEILFDYSMSKNANPRFEYTYIEEMPYTLSVGVKQEAKHNMINSGDNFSNIVLPNNTHLIALADGMGSGLKASNQSKRVLNMLEDMLGCGDNEFNAVSTINSILVLEEGNEIFTTLDIFLFNMYTCEGEFIKAGAMTTFIKRNDEVNKIDTKALPIGIVDKIKIKKKKTKLEVGDFLYIMSDGFVECFENDENMIAKAIMEHSYRNPQKIANELFDIAYEKSKNVLKDDVSIVVCKVRKS